MRIFLVLPTIALLSGCAGSIVGDSLAGPDKLAARDDAYCKSVGAEPGSDKYYHCRMSMSQRREDRVNSLQ